MSSSTSLLTAASFSNKRRSLANLDVAAKLQCTASEKNVGGYYEADINNDLAALLSADFPEEQRKSIVGLFVDKFGGMTSDELLNGMREVTKRMSARNEADGVAKAGDENASCARATCAVSS